MLDGRPVVGLFVTCLVDFFRPSVGFAAIDLLQDSGCRVDVPLEQTCCGQPGYNAGDRRAAREIAERVIDTFIDYDYMVLPSGSCAGMIRCHYPGLFDDSPSMRAMAQRLGEKTFELTSFLVDVMGMTPRAMQLNRTAAYHDSCAGLRELGIRDQPRALLSAAEGLNLDELEDRDVCCGFGGTFCVKYPSISARMASNKIAAIKATGADMLLGGDMGCLLNLAGKLKRDGNDIEVRHVAEILAARLDDAPGIGDP